MPTHTDSAIVEYNEDGSRTVTTVETIYPATTSQKVGAWAGLVLICVAPLTPLLVIPALERWEEKREARKEKKRLKAVK